MQQKPPEETQRLSKMVNDYSEGGQPNRVRFLELINGDYDEENKISQQTFNRIFNPDTRTGKFPDIPVTVLKAIAAHTEYNISWLLTGRGNMKSMPPGTKTPPAREAAEGVKNSGGTLDDAISLLKEIKKSQDAGFFSLQTTLDQVLIEKGSHGDQSGPDDLVEKAEALIQAVRVEESKSQSPTGKDRAARKQSSESGS